MTKILDVFGLNARFGVLTQNIQLNHLQQTKILSITRFVQTINRTNDTFQDLILTHKEKRS